VNEKKKMNTRRVRPRKENAPHTQGKGEGETRSGEGTGCHNLACMMIGHSLKVVKNKKNASFF
jgi:hypothetical protein